MASEKFTYMTEKDYDSVYSKIISTITETTKFKLTAQDKKVDQFFIEGKTKIAWLQNAYPTHLKLNGTKINGQIKIEFEVYSKIDSITQKEANYINFQNLVIQLQKALD